MPILDINTDAVVKYSAKLEKINKTALPVAVRGALNAAALDMKKDTILHSAASSFIQRKPTFFKATTHINFASGYDLRTMEATIGFVGNSQAIEDLKVQEHGGEIKGRAFIATNEARVGKSYKKNIRPNMRIKALKIIDAKNARGKNDAEKFIESVLYAGVGGNVLSSYKGKQYVWRVNGFKRDKGKWDFKLSKIYTFKKGRKVHPKKITHFMETASFNSASKMEKFFIVEAEKQFKKALV